MMNADQIVDLILDPTNGFTREQLLKISEAVKIRFDVIRQLAAGSFRKGDKVKFLNSRSGEMLHGVVTKINPKNIKVAVTQLAMGDFPREVTWTVSPGLLSKDD